MRETKNSTNTNRERENHFPSIAAVLQPRLSLTLNLATSSPDHMWNTLPVSDSGCLVVRLVTRVKRLDVLTVLLVVTTFIKVVRFDVAVACATAAVVFLLVSEVVWTALLISSLRIVRSLVVISRARECDVTTEGWGFVIGVWACVVERSVKEP